MEDPKKVLSEDSDDSPLRGLRIVALEQFGAGPFASLALSDLGAEVIKIEDPATGGDVGRYVPPAQVAGNSLYFETFNRGKRSLALDMKCPAGRSVFDRLVRTADVVFNNLRGDLPEVLGLTYANLSSLNRRIVCVSLSGYARDSDRRREPGYDALVQAEAGWAALTGEPEAPPTKSGLSMADYAAGLTAALAIMAGVFDAQRSGRGRDLDLNLFDVATWLLTYPATWYLSRGHPTDRSHLSAHPTIVPFQFFEAADGFLAIACAKQRFFEILVDRLGLPELSSDPRFRDFEARHTHRDTLTALLTAKLRERPVARWLELLRGRVPIAPVRSMPEVLDDPALLERGLIVSYEHDRLGSVRTLVTPIKTGEDHPRGQPAPHLGADRDRILESLGYKEEDIRRLGEGGAFGALRQPPPD
jgi:crotonobetainyl-CoA:carnitine CoA-transferase CaiB-like acyl-CoA transferase